MDRKGTLIKGTVLAVMLGTGLTGAAAIVAPRTASAATLDDQQQQLEVNLADESFRVDSTAKADGHGHTRITGYVYSSKGRDADQVQLRIAELDASGNTVATYFERMLEDVPADGRGYFDVKVPTSPNAAKYQVNVYSWNTVEGLK
jgi:hypothetical protein